MRKHMKNKPNNAQERTNDVALSDKLVDKKFIAKTTSASIRTIENWVKQRKIPIVRISPRCVRFHAPSVVSALRRLEVVEVGR
jgi:phage terminase Nu1 subunit (DNA packaging protein)